MIRYIQNLFAKSGYDYAMKIATGMCRDNLVREVHVLNFMQNGIVKPRVVAKASIGDVVVDFSKVKLSAGTRTSKDGRKILSLTKVPETKIVEGANADLLAEIKAEADRRNAIALGKQAAAARRVELQSRAVKAINQTSRCVGNLTTEEIARRRAVLQMSA